MKAKQQNGFTFVEAIIAVALVGILTTIAIPSYAKLKARNQLVVSANQLLSATLHARALAVSRNTTVSFCAGNPSEGCHGNWNQGEWISFVDHKRDGQLGSEDTLLASEQLPGSKRLELTVNGPFRRVVLFRPAGNATWPSGAFAAGRMRLCAPNTELDAVELVLIGSGRAVIEKRGLEGRCPSL